MGKGVMDQTLIEQLLHDAESSSLDFKRDQYPFEGQPDRAKSELLKDILAFANTLRTGEAFILIGVEEVKGGRSIPKGVSQHMDDASLQQFVGSKVNKPISFAYQAVQFEGVSIGALSIPPQDGPFFVKDDYGKVRRNTVYMRRGSSTVELTPDELVKQARSKRVEPSLDFQFADIRTRKGFGGERQISSEVLRPMNPGDVCDYGGRAIYTGANIDYYREMNDFVMLDKLVSLVGFSIYNPSGEVLHDVRANIVMPRLQGFYAMDENGMPKRPVKNTLLESNYGGLDFDPNCDVIVSEYGKELHVQIEFGKVQPQSVNWTSSCLYIGSMKSRRLDLEAIIYADNLSQPQRKLLVLEFDAITVGNVTYDLMNDFGGDHEGSE